MGGALGSGRYGRGIQEQMHKQHIHIQHIFREENQLADYITNLAYEEGTTLIFTEFKQVPK